MARSCCRATVAVLSLFALSACDDNREDRYAKLVSELTPEVEAAVGLKFRTPPRVDSRSEEQVRAFAEEQLKQDLAVRELRGIEATYKVLGLIPDTMDLGAFLLDLYAEQIAGYYDPATKVLYISERAPREAVRITVAHELVHALQDQYIDLDSIQKLEGDADRKTAAHAVIEGQATYEQLVIMLGGDDAIEERFPGGWEGVRQLIRQESSRMPIFSTSPLVLQEGLTFPYLSGAEFVRRFEQRNPGEVPYDAMPTSTEQIMHPRAYFGTRDEPTEVVLPPVSGATAVYENTLGEFETRLFLYEHLRDLPASVRGAAGWDGDRFVVVRTEAGDGIVWASVWDSPVEAGEFVDLMERTIARRLRNPESTGSTSSVKRYESGGRVVELATIDLQGRAAVLFVDLPKDAGEAGVDRRQIRLRF